MRLVLSGLFEDHLGEKIILGHLGETIPYTLAEFTLGEITEQNVTGLYDGPFPWENQFGFRLAGMFGNDFLKRYAVTFDFTNMRIIFR